MNFDSTPPPVGWSIQNECPCYHPETFHGKQAVEQTVTTQILQHIHIPELLIDATTITLIDINGTPIGLLPWPSQPAITELLGVRELQLVTETGIKHVPCQT